MYAIFVRDLDGEVDYFVADENYHDGTANRLDNRVFKTRQEAEDNIPA